MSDPSTGQASGSEQESATVNALGQAVTSTDRNGTVHTLSYDVLGSCPAYLPGRTRSGHHPISDTPTGHPADLSAFPPTPGVSPSPFAGPWRTDPL